jgi:hypothetical protein
MGLKWLNKYGTAAGSLRALHKIVNFSNREVHLGSVFFGSTNYCNQTHSPGLLKSVSTVSNFTVVLPAVRLQLFTGTDFV